MPEGVQIDGSDTHACILTYRRYLLINITMEMGSTN